MNLPPQPLRSCPALNWLMKPGEPVWWYKRCVYSPDHKAVRWDGRDDTVPHWIRITEAEARRIACNK